MSNGGTQNNFGCSDISNSNWKVEFDNLQVNNESSHDYFTTQIQSIFNYYNFEQVNKYLDYKTFANIEEQLECNNVC